MKGWGVFRIGLSRAARYRWVLPILFTVNLLSALLLALLPALGLAAEFGHRPAIREAADGVDAWLVVETLAAPLSGTALGDGWPELTRRLRQATLLGLLTAAMLPLLAWLPSTFLSGGVLLTYAEAPQPFRWRRFLWGCYHWWGAFLLLGVVQGGVSVAVFVPTIAIVGGTVAAAGEWLAWVAVPLLVFLAMLWLVLMEYTRIVAVVEETRHVAHAFGEAMRFVFRHPLPVAGFYGLAFLLLGALHVLYRWGLMPHLPLGWWSLVLIVQQAFVLARLWAWLVRLAGGVALYQGE
ncbi:MAG: hypothetical protein SWK90_07625 [Chloroflexota bacterium]|nr:hypothetical protein [Chloroflexota bacterium]